MLILDIQTDCHIEICHELIQKEIKNTCKVIQGVIKYLKTITVTGSLKIAVIGIQKVELVFITLTIVKNCSELCKPTVNKCSRTQPETEAGNTFCILSGSLKTPQNITKRGLFVYLH